MSVSIIRGDARALPLPDDSVDLVVTSPPYFGLRSYQDGGEHYAGQLGSEPTPAEFVDALLAVTAECVRVLKPSGSMWVNLGDKYGSASLLGLPWRYALRCTDDLGLLLRAEMIWDKPNAFIDAKARDRVRRTHETWFHFATQRAYYHQVDDLREAPTTNYHERPQYVRALELFAGHGFTEKHMAAVRSVGIIDSRGGQVRSGGSWSSESGRLAAEVQAALRSYYRELCGNSAAPKGNVPRSVRTVAAEPLKLPARLGVDHFAAFPSAWPAFIVRGWSPPGGVVLDPFGGTGTTAMVASVLGRQGVSIDMSADYCRVAAWRTSDPAQLSRVGGDAA